MLYNLSNKRFKHFWFALMYVAFLLVGIIYSCTLFTHSNPKTKTWQDVANYDFELLNRTFADGILTNTYGISTPEQLAGVFNDKFPGIGGGTIIKPPDLGDIGDIIDKPPIIVGPGAGGIEIGGSGDTSIVDLDDIQKVDNVYTLLNDIDLTEKNYTWEILDTFSGKFNGNYHTIKGLTIKESVESVGMVGELSSGGEIKNLYLDDVVISNETSSSKTTYTGAIAGKNNGIIQNVHVIDGSVGGHSGSNDTRYVGGIVGYNNSNGEIRACSNGASISKGNYIGGISGYNNGTIGGSSDNKSFACFNYGQISSVFTNNVSYSGGITGYSTKSISLCYNSGQILNNDYMARNTYAGGIVGYTTGAIDQCANVGTIVSGIDKYITGYYNGQPQYSDSKVQTSYAGGIAGRTSSSISWCYNNANITAEAVISSPYIVDNINSDNEILGKISPSEQFILDKYVNKNRGLPDTKTTDWWQNFYEKGVSFTLGSMFEIEVDYNHSYIERKFTDFYSIFRNNEFSIVESHKNAYAGGIVGSSSGNVNGCISYDCTIKGGYKLEEYKREVIIYVGGPSVHYIEGENDYKKQSVSFSSYEQYADGINGNLSVTNLNCLSNASVVVPQELKDDITKISVEGDDTKTIFTETYVNNKVYLLPSSRYKNSSIYYNQQDVIINGNSYYDPLYDLYIYGYEYHETSGNVVFFTPYDIWVRDRSGRLYKCAFYIYGYSEKPDDIYKENLSELVVFDFNNTEIKKIGSNKYGSITQYEGDYYIEKNGKLTLKNLYW